MQVQLPPGSSLSNHSSEHVLSCPLLHYQPSPPPEQAHTLLHCTIYDPSPTFPRFSCLLCVDLCPAKSLSTHCHMLKLSCVCVCVCMWVRSTHETAAWRALNTLGRQRTQLLKQTGSEPIMGSPPYFVQSLLWILHCMYYEARGYAFILLYNKKCTVLIMVDISKLCSVLPSCWVCPKCFFCSSGQRFYWNISSLLSKTEFCSLLVLLGHLWRKRKAIPYPSQT